MDFKKVKDSFYYEDSLENKYIKNSDEYSEFDALFNNELQSILMVDLQGNILKMNHKFQHSLNNIKNINVEVGTPVLSIISPENKERFQLDFAKALAGEKAIHERWIKDLHGADYCFIYEYVPIKKEGKVSAVMMSILDITSIRATNKIISNHEQQYLALVDGHHSALFITRPDGSIVNANESAVQMFGYTREEFLQLTRHDFIDHDDPRLEHYINKRSEVGMVQGELIGIKKNGVRFPIEFSSVLFNNSITGELQTSTLINDITHKKRDEKISKETNRVAKVGGWELNLVDYNLYWTDVTKEIHEVDFDFITDYETAVNFYVEGEYREGIKNAVQQVIDTGEAFEGDFKIITAKGKERWVRTKILVEMQEGKAVRLFGTFQDIDEQKKIYLRLEHLRFALDQHALVNVTNYQGEIIYVNDKFAELSGYSKEELLGSTHRLLKSEVHNDEFFKEFNETIYAGKVWTGEICNTKKTGENYWLRMTVVPFKDFISNEIIEFISICSDITENKEEEIRLKLLESVITNTNDAVIITEAEPFSEPGPRIVYVNDAFTKMTGYSKEEVLGKSPRILQGPLSDKAELARLGEALRKWESAEIEVINYKKNGEQFWVNFSVVPIADKNGWYTHWVSVQRETTTRKKYEEERQHLIDELSNSINELKQFTYITSHNMRAPVTNLLGIFNILDTSTITDEFTLQLIEGLRKSTYNLNETLNDLIKILIIKENSNQSLTEVSFEESLENVKRSIASILDNNDVSMLVDFSKAEKVLFNKSYLESIFLNLITNSVRYAHPERRIQITIASKMENDTITLVYSDNGLGMDMEKVRGQIFGLYKRFHNHPESKGVGLYLVHSQVTSLGGSIDVDSEVNVGTTFTIKFKK